MKQEVREIFKWQLDHQIKVPSIKGYIFVKYKGNSKWHKGPKIGMAKDIRKYYDVLCTGDHSEENDKTIDSIMLIYEKEIKEEKIDNFKSSSLF